MLFDLKKYIYFLPYGVFLVKSQHSKISLQDDLDEKKILQTHIKSEDVTICK